MALAVLLARRNAVGLAHGDVDAAGAEQAGEAVGLQRGHALPLQPQLLRQHRRNAVDLASNSTRRPGQAEKGNK